MSARGVPDTGASAAGSAGAAGSALSLQVLEDHVGASVGHRGVRRKVLEHEVADVVAFAGGQVQNEVFGAAKEEHLSYLGERLHLIHKLTQLLAGARAKGHANQHLHAISKRRWVDARVEALDNTLFYEVAHSGDASALSDMPVLFS